MLIPFLNLPFSALLPWIVAVGCCLGTVAWFWGAALSPLPGEAPLRLANWRSVPILGTLVGLGIRSPKSSSATPGRLLTEVSTGALFAMLVWMMVVQQSQHTPEVSPSEAGRFWRILFHLALLVFLVTATVSDLRDYLIPDPIILTGIAVGVLGHLVSGELQIQHIWIDWNGAIEGIKGPDFPLWIDQHRHWHGLAVSLAGMAAGSGMTFLVREVSSRLLGQEAMGLGDVTLMAMIGAFVGWQPILFVFLLAPICGLVLSLLQQFVGGKHYLPFGPFLALATVVVLCAWQWLWMPMRYIFGHWPTLLGLMGGAAGGFVILLILARLYRMIPVGGEHRYSTGQTATTAEASVAVEDHRPVDSQVEQGEGSENVE